MPHLKKYKAIKPVKSKLNILLTTEMGIFSKLSKKKIKFNPRPFSEKKEANKTKKNLVDFHLEIVKKIDALITEHEKEAGFEEEPEAPLEELVEIREPLKRKPEISDFKSIGQSKNICDYLDFENELFKAELTDKANPSFRFVRNLEEPKDIVYIKNIENNDVKDDDFHSRMLGGSDKANEKPTMGLAHIKVRNKEERVGFKAARNKSKRTSSPKKIETNKINEFSLVKKELEETKKEIEEKKKELELAEKRAKIEAEELKEKKKEKIERKKEEKKLKKLELKKAKIEAKERERKLREKTKIETKKEKLEAKMALKEEKLKRKLESKKKKIGKPEKETESVLKVRKTDDKKKKEKSKSSTKGLHHFILGKKEVEKENPILDEDVRRVLRLTDNLLEKLPDEVIDEFVKSDDFALYEKVISKYKIK